MGPGDDRAGQGPYAGAVAVDYPGVTFVLGRTAEGYAIWQAAGGVPLHTFPLTDQGWGQAWAAWRGMEGPGQPASSRDWQRRRPIPLGPMRAGQVIGGAVRLYRLNFGILLAVVAPAMVGLYAVIIGLTMATLGPITIQTAFGPRVVTGVPGWVTFVQGLLNALVIQFLTAAVARAAVDIFRGAAPSVGRTYRFAFMKIFAVGWVLILTYVVMALPVLPGVIALWAGVRTGSDAAGAIGAILIMAAIPAVLFLFVRLVLAPVTVALEDLRGGAALQRAWRLSKGVGWRILGVYILAILIALGVQLVVGIVVGIPILTSGATVTKVNQAIVLAAGGLATTFVTPFLNLVVILLYVDARVRKEGSDPDRLWGAFAEPVAAQPGPG